MSDTRGPRPGKVPPHVQDRLAEKRQRAERRAAAGPAWRRTPAIVTYVVIAVLVGLGIGASLFGGSPNEEAAEVITAQIVPLANEANAVWTVGTAERPAVAEFVGQATLSDDVSAIVANHDSWLAAVDDVTGRLEGVAVPAEAAGVHALYLDSVHLTRQAIEVLGAAAAHEGVARNELLTEAQRLRAMSETVLDQATRALVGLQGGDAGLPSAPILPPVTGPTEDPQARFAPAPEPGGTEAPVDPTTEPDSEPTATDAPPTEAPAEPTETPSPASS